MTKSAVAMWCVIASIEALSAFATPEPELHVYLSDGVGSSERLLAAIRAEVETIYASAGVRIVWLAEPPNPEKEFDARVYLLDELLPSLRGTMRITTTSEPMAIALGTHPTAFAGIYVSKKAVFRRIGHRYPLVRNNMARALGRTIAHELAHRFLSPAHTAQGILRPILSEWDLIDEDRSDLFFTTDQRLRLRANANANANGTANSEGNHLISSRRP